MANGIAVERVAAVVDQVREQRDGPGQREHDRLQHRGDCEDPEADRDGAHAGAGPDDRRVDLAVRVPVVSVVVVVVVTGLLWDRTGIARCRCGPWW